MAYGELVQKNGGESSETIRKRVEAAGERQAARFRGTDILFNARMTGRDVKHYCSVTGAQEAFLKRVFEQKGLSARAYHRILKVARTIADLRDGAEISMTDLAEAVGYRGPEEKFWR